MVKTTTKDATPLLAERFEAAERALADASVEADEARERCNKLAASIRTADSDELRNALESRLKFAQEKRLAAHQRLSDARAAAAAIADERKLPSLASAQQQKKVIIERILKRGERIEGHRRAIGDDLRADEDDIKELHELDREPGGLVSRMGHALHATQRRSRFLVSLNAALEGTVYYKRPLLKPAADVTDFAKVSARVYGQILAVGERRIEEVRRRIVEFEQGGADHEQISA